MLGAPLGAGAALPNNVGVAVVVGWAPNGELVVLLPNAGGFVAPKLGAALLALGAPNPLALAGVEPKAGAAPVAGAPKPLTLAGPKMELPGAFVGAGAEAVGAPNCGVGLMLPKDGRPPVVDGEAPNADVLGALELGAPKADGALVEPKADGVEPKDKEAGCCVWPNMPVGVLDELAAGAYRSEWNESVIR